MSNGVILALTAAYHSRFPRVGGLHPRALSLELWLRLYTSHFRAGCPSWFLCVEHAQSPPVGLHLHRSPLPLPSDQRGRCTYGMRVRRSLGQTANSKQQTVNSKQQSAIGSQTEGRECLRRPGALPSGYSMSRLQRDGEHACPIHRASPKGR